MIRRIFIFVTLLSMFFCSCKKDWLEVKPAKSLVVPTSIADYQALLNNRQTFGVRYPMFTEQANGDSYFIYTRWLSLTNFSRAIYIWDANSYQQEPSADWSLSYQQILSCNVVLEGIQAIPFDITSKPQWDSVKGQALFYRAFCFYNLSQEFCRPYNLSTAGKDLGLPLRLTTNVIENVSRSSLEHTYNQIINDLLLARDLLPDNQSFKTQPTKNAVLGLLARIYLSMENYSLALSMAEQGLSINKTLLDYNTLNASATYPFPPLNAEVIWNAEMSNSSNLASGNAVIIDDLFALYNNNDLRKTLFFRSNGPDGRRFTGSYRGDRSSPFCGIANDELYLIRAECYARSGKISEGINDINTLLKTRYKLGTNGKTTYIDQSAATEIEALNIILAERRKQLILRNVRWSDLRRLNKDIRFQTILKRVLDGVEYTLPPNDPRYTFPIPADEIRLSGIEQNSK